jgi:hypothetical protein
VVRFVAQLKNPICPSRKPDEALSTLCIYDYSEFGAMPASETPNDFLTIDGARDLLKSMGIPCNDSQIRRWAYERALPFFKWGKRLMISSNELTLHIRRLQAEAVNRSSR